MGRIAARAGSYGAMWGSNLYRRQGGSYGGRGL